MTALHRTRAHSFNRLFHARKRHKLHSRLKSMRFGKPRLVIGDRCSERRLVGEATPFLYMAENEGFEFLIDGGANFRDML
jgi:hypothetical protein